MANSLTNMVGEFDTLQGVMGGIYAKRMGENDAVASAVREQYLPAGPDSPLPVSATGAILSIADKVDTMAGCFGLGLIPTGAADPNALRRCALGIISGKTIYICQSGKSADFPDLLFHGRGRSGKRHLQRRFLRKCGAADSVLDLFPGEERNG